MVMVARMEGSGEIPVLKADEVSRRWPLVRADEVICLDGALPDPREPLRELAVDEALEEAVESGRLRWSINLRTGETVLSVRTR